MHSYFSLYWQVVSINDAIIYCDCYEIYHVYSYFKGNYYSLLI